MILEFRFELQQFKLPHILGMNLCLVSSTQIVCNVLNLMNDWLAHDEYLLYINIENEFRYQHYEWLFISGEV